MEQKQVIEERLETAVADQYDVVVCGGGFAGISAALAAARHGKRTLLLEKQFVLGGLGTAGIVTIYLPLCDGYGHQVSFGIAEELLRLSIRDGAEARYPSNWLDGQGTRTEQDPRYEVQYNPHLFAILAEKLLLSAGVDILYGTYAVGVEMQGQKIRHIITEGKSGRRAYRARAVVDATGDCDIASFAKAPTDRFEAGNVLAAWYYSTGGAGYRLHMVGYADIPAEEKTEQNKVPLLSDRRYQGLDSEEISDFVCDSHTSTYNHFRTARKQDPSLFPVTMATMPQLRMTRKLRGEYVLKNEDEHTYFADSVGMVSNWIHRGPVYEIPFRMLYNSGVKNLITAGRCVSTTEQLWNILRVIPCCAVTGQAAGTAAAMTDDFSTLDVAALQQLLRADGVVLHESELS